MSISPSSQTVLVTGASGFLGSYIVYQLLEEGYTVKGAARGAKVALLKNAFAKYSNFEAVDIPDIASGDFSEILKGVDAIIHTAAPIPGRADAVTALRSAIDGSLHVLQEAVKAGVAKAVVTSSLSSFNPNGPWGIDDWNSITYEDALKGNYWATYNAEKKLADQAALAFGDEHPEIDITSLSPGWIFGPFPPGFEHIVPAPDFKPFSSNGYIYALLRPENEHYPMSFGVVDVRDVAKAHILALRSAPAKELGHRKRYVVVSPHSASYSRAIEIISRARPELKARLPDASNAPTFDWPDQPKLYRKGLEEVVGFSESGYSSWEDTVLDTVDSLIALEKVWRDKGFAFEMPTESPL